MWGFGPVCTADTGLGTKCHSQLSESDVQGLWSWVQQSSEQHWHTRGLCRSLHHGSYDTHVACWASIQSHRSQALLFSMLVKSQLSHRWLLSALPTKMQTPDNNGLQSPLWWRPTAHSPIPRRSSFLSHLRLWPHTPSNNSQNILRSIPLQSRYMRCFSPPGMFLSPCFTEQVFLTL